jgi:hypothetical protein
VYFRFGIGPFRFSQRLTRTAAQRRRAATARAARLDQREANLTARAEARDAEARAREAEAKAREAARHLMGDVSGYYADATVVKFSIEDWINLRTLSVAVPRDKATPEIWDTLAKVHDGAVVMADFEAEPGGPGSSGTADFKFIWNADGTPGPDNDGSPEMTHISFGHPAYFGFRSYVERKRVERLAEEHLERLRQELEEAKHTGHLLLGDGEVDAWHGVTPSGRQCHHRHRSPEAASECATRLQRQEA